MGSAVQSGVTGLAQMGHEVHALVCELGEIGQVLEKYPEIKWHETGDWSFWNLGRHLRRLYHEVKPDILYVQSAWTIAAVYCSGILRKHRPYVYHTVDYLEPGRYRFRKWLEKRFAHRAGLVASNEINRARFMCSEYRLPKMPVVLPVALSEHFQPPAYDFSDVEADWKPARLLYVGSLGRERMVPEIIQSLQYLPDTYTLDVYGRSPDEATKRECDKAAEETGVAGRIRYHDPLPNPEMVPMMPRYDVGILVYDDSSLGNFYCQPQKLSEYVGSGLPIVGPNYPGIEILTAKHEIGATCDPTDPQAIAAAVERVAAKNIKERREQSARLRGVFRDHLAYERGLAPLKAALANLEARIGSRG